MPEQPQPTAAELGAALTPKHRKFADAYLANGLNAAAASREEGYKNPREGNRLLQRADISAYVQARLDEAGMTTAEIRARLEYMASGDMRDMLRVAPTERSYWVPAAQHEEIREAAKRRGTTVDALDNYDIAGIVGGENVALTEHGVLMVCIRQVASEVVVDWRAAQEAQALGRIRKIKVGKDGGVEFELHDPVRALELLGKAQRMFVERQEHSGPDGEPLKLYACIDPERV